MCIFYVCWSRVVHKLHRVLSFARVPEVPDVVKTPLAAMSAGTFGIAEPWWPAAQGGKTPLPDDVKLYGNYDVVVATHHI